MTSIKTNISQFLVSVNKRIAILYVLIYNKYIKTERGVQHGC